MPRACVWLYAVALQAFLIACKAADVHQLHPSDIKAVLTLGDSISAAEAAKGLGLLEDRWLSFTGGAGLPGQHTMPYLLKTLGGAEAIGASAGVQRQTTQFTYRAPAVEKLNAAVCGSDSSDWEKQLDHLIKVYPDFMPKSAPHVNETDWKLFTIFFGANDVCTHWEPCYNPHGSLRESQERVADRFQRNLEQLILRIIDRFGGNIYINLPALFDIGSVARIQQSHWGCRLKLAVPFAIDYECKCIMSWKYPNGIKIDPIKAGHHLTATIREMNRRLEQVAAKYDRYNGRSDIGVNFAEFMRDVKIPSIDYVSYGFDCFHPSDLAHDRLGVGLWNSMLEVDEQQANLSVPWFKIPLNVTSNSRLVTYKDRIAKNLANATLQQHPEGTNDQDVQKPAHSVGQMLFM